jgi:serine/threonine protein kinase
MNDVNLDLLEQLNCPHCGVSFRESLPLAFKQIVCEQCGKGSIVPGKFGEFLLYEHQSESVTSIVFDAFDPKLGRNVTLKILNSVLSKNPELVEAFKNEALAAASLNSTYVLKVYEFGVHNRQPFMVLEHIEGQFLHDVMQKEQISHVRILDMLDGIVQGLEDMHEQGIMHGDVMPRNILIHTDGTPRICDFGLARFSNQSNDGSQWESWSSPYYMPPERIKGEPEDFRGDFYSLGTTLYNLLTGELPFFDLDESVVLQRKQNEDPPDPRHIRPEMNDDLSELTGSLLQRNPKDRPSSYEELRFAISEIKLQMPKPEREIPEPDLIPDYQQSSKRKKREPFAWFVFMILAGILIAMLISLPHQDAENPLPPLPTSKPLAAATALLPTPDPTPTPLPTSIPTPTRQPPSIQTSVEDPFASSALEIHLIPDETSFQNDRAISEWKDQRNGRVTLVQKNENLQPKAFRINSQPVLKFSKSLMISSLQPAKLDSFTLIAFISSNSYMQTGASAFLLGQDPRAPGQDKFCIALHPSLNAGVLFETDRGSAILVLPQEERGKPFLLGFRRGEDGDRAYLGTRTALLSRSETPHSTGPATTFAGFQVGGLDPGERFFDGWIGEFLFYTESITDPQIDIVYDHLYQKFGVTF